MALPLPARIVLLNQSGICNNHAKVSDKSIALPACPSTLVATVSQNSRRVQTKRAWRGLEP